MQIFPSLPSPSSFSDSAAFNRENSLFSLVGGNFEDVFGSYVHDAREDALFHPSLPESLRAEPVRKEGRHVDPAKPHEPVMPERGADVSTQPAGAVRDEGLHRPQHLDKPVNREDFAQLRRKLEALGLDQDTMDRIEKLFGSAETVTWEQVLGVLREPLRELAQIKLAPDQETHLISLFEKIGFTPDSAKQLVLDLLNKNHDAVWKRIQQMLTALGDGQKISIAPAEMLALLQALGLNRAATPGSFDSGPGKLFGLSEKSFANVDPKSVNAMQVIADALKKAGIEMTPELGSVVQTALREKADVMQRVVEAAAKGELKLDPEQLSAFQGALKNTGGGSGTLDKILEQGTGKELTPEALRKVLAALQSALKDTGGGPVALDKIVQHVTDKELTPDELKQILAMLEQAATGRDRGNTARDQVLTEVQKVMAAAENREPRMQAADNGPNAPRVSMVETMNALKTMASGGNGNDSETLDRNANQGKPWENPTGRNDSNNAAQGWESFWSKINVQGAGVVSGSVLKDAGSDPRSLLGQSNSANHAEAAARRILSNAPAPHRVVLNQVHSGLLQNMGQGRQQLTLQLHPAELGSLTVNLRVVGKEVQAVLRAENQEARQIVAENLPLLRQSLESHGLRVSRLEVQTQLQDQNQFTQLWQGSDGKRFQEQGAQAQWTALGRGQLKNNAGGEHPSSEQASILLNPSREGGINLIA